MNLELIHNSSKLKRFLIAAEAKNLEGLMSNDLPEIRKALGRPYYNKHWFWERVWIIETDNYYIVIKMITTGINASNTIIIKKTPLYLLRAALALFGFPSPTVNIKPIKGDILKIASIKERMLSLTKIFPIEGIQYER